MLVSGVQQSDSVIHIHVSILFQILFPFSLLQNIEECSLCCVVGPCCWNGFFFLYFIFYFWLHWVFVAVQGLSLVVVSRGYSWLWCAGVSLRWLLLLRSMASRVCRLSSCGARAYLLRGMWDPPGPGLEPMSPALAGRFLTTAPPGKPWNGYF